MRTARLIAPAALLFLAIGGCARPGGDYPSLSPRAAEAIDPRLPLPSEPSPGTLDPTLSSRLAAAVGTARAEASAFDRLAAIAERAAAAAGPGQSESWVAAQQALSALVAQHGATTRAAADVDALAATRIDETRWISPANRRAIEEAAASIGAINARQTGIIAGLRRRLER